MSEWDLSSELDPFRETTADVIEREGPLHMARDLDPLPGGEVVVNLLAGVANLHLHRLHFGVEIEVVFVRMGLELGARPIP